MSTKAHVSFFCAYCVDTFLLWQTIKVHVSDVGRFDSRMNKDTASEILDSLSMEWLVEGEVVIEFNEGQDIAKDDENMRDDESADETDINNNDPSNISNANSEYISEPIESTNRKADLACAICDKEFSTKGNVQKYVKRKHSSERFECGVCNKKICTVYDLKSHSKTHSKELHQCTICGKLFISKSYLKLHTNEHNGVFKFYCQVCGKGFNRRYLLDGHVSSHTDDKLLKCDKCDKTFRYTTSLIRHKNICVTTASTIYCDICNKKFKRVDYMKEHKLVHDNPDRYQCVNCGKYYRQRAGLYNHKKRTVCGTSRE